MKIDNLFYLLKKLFSKLIIDTSVKIYLFIDENLI